jgi:hypothetical protein
MKGNGHDHGGRRGHTRFMSREAETFVRVLRHVQELSSRKTPGIPAAFLQADGRRPIGEFGDVFDAVGSGSPCGGHTPHR